MANKIVTLIKDKQLKNQIYSIKKKTNIKDSLTCNGVPLFENIGSFINSEGKKSSTNHELFCYGTTLAATFLEYFCGFRQDSTKEQLKQNIINLSIKNLSVTNVAPLESFTGINALNISYNLQKDSISWNHDFKDFIKSKELKITHWINPVEQIITCIIISKIFNCYFDAEHHFKSMLSIFKMDDLVLQKHMITRSTYKKEQLDFLNMQLPNYANKLDSSISSNKYYPKYRSYPILKFAKSLPSECNEYLNKYLEMLSVKNKSQSIRRFKDLSYIGKILMIAFDKNLISDRDANSFRYIYNSQSDKKTLLANCIKMPYKEFKCAMDGYNRLTENLYSTRPLKKLINERKDFFNLLMAYEKDFQNPNNVFREIIGLIPNKKILFEDEEEFKNYKVKQVLSQQELKKVGHDFSNCLRNYPQYGKKLISKNNLEYFFTFKTARVRNSICRDFICYLKIYNKKIEILEMKRYGNANCSQAELSIMYEFFIDKNISNIPEEYYAHYLMKLMNGFIENTFSTGIKKIIEDAPLIFALLKRLKKSKRWLYDVDNELIPQSVNNLLIESLSEQEGILLNNNQNHEASSANELI